MTYTGHDAIQADIASFRTALDDAGLILQLDDPAIAESWDQVTPEPSVEAYQRFTMRRVEARN